MTEVPWALAEGADPDLARLWSPGQQVRDERHMWTVIMFAQEAAGVPFPRYAIADYVHVSDRVDLEDIARRERVTRHDLKARLEAFNDLAGHECAHLGLTSADIVDNLMQWRIRRSLIRLHGKINQLGPQQAARPLWDAIGRYTLRGLKGATGTQTDLLQLVGGDPAKVDAIERDFALALGFKNVLNSIGQVYPRSLDLDVATALLDALMQLGAGGPMWPLVDGYFSMVASMVDDQWNEGDVSSSVVRRVAWPGLVLAADRALTAWHVARKAPA